MLVLIIEDLAIPRDENVYTYNANRSFPTPAAETKFMILVNLIVLNETAKKIKLMHKLLRTLIFRKTNLYVPNFDYSL